MPLNWFVRRSFIPLLTGAGIICAGVLALNLNDPDAVIGSSFGRVLSGDGEIVQSRWINKPENFLKANILPAVNTLAMRPQNLLSVGDQIMLTQPDRSENSFRILNVEFLNDTVTRIDTSLNAAHQLLITAQDLDDKGGRIIKFVLDIGTIHQDGPAPSGDQIL